MRKSGWAVAAGLGMLALLLTACGGSSSSSSSSSASSSSTPKAAGQPSAAVGLPSPGTQVLIVQRSNLGWVLAKADGTVVYTYGNDTKGGTPTCTGSCAAAWPAVTGLPKVGPADTLPGPLGTVTMAKRRQAGHLQRLPPVHLQGRGALSTKGNGLDGEWHVIKLSASNVATTG